MKYPDEIIQKVTACGVFGYEPDQIFNIVDLPEEERAEFVLAFQDPDSQLCKAFKKGVDQAQFAIDTALFAKVQKGDLNALRLYNERMEQKAFMKNKSGR